MLMEWRPPGLSVCLPLVILPSTIKSRGIFRLAPAHAGGPRKTVVVVMVVIIVEHFKDICKHIHGVAVT